MESGDTSFEECMKRGEIETNRNRDPCDEEKGGYNPLPNKIMLQLI